MTRKTRTRRPRVQSLQSGYCEICHIPYNSIDDHIQSKRHQKLIGEDAGYIAINGFLNQEANIERFLNLNIDTTLANGTIDNDISPRPRRRNMRRTRAASVVCERVKPSPLSPAHSEIIGHHHLRSRRNINYMTPPLDEDSLTESEKPDFSPPPPLSPPPIDNPNRGLRSSSRVLAKLAQDKNCDVWNSGRPKRSCIKQRRTSTDERLLSENSKTYYKVEVLSSKLRSSQSRELELSKQSHKGEDLDKEKGLIVKFKKLRNSELVQLNNEATNFLFPTKKDDSSDEEGDPDTDGANTTASTGKNNDSTLMVSSEEEDVKTPSKFKVEDEVSLDSVSSESRRKKKRRTHAEAFIMDNHKYYKFEMPGSRLRYQGSYLSTPPEPMKSPRSNGDCMAKMENEEKPAVRKNFKLKLDDYKFSFEVVPKNEQWYNTFRRQDTGEIRYAYFSDYFWDSFIMPYQMGPLPPLDPRKCIQQFAQIKKLLSESPSACSSVGCTTPDPSISNSGSSFKYPDVQDEDSKISMISTLSSSSTIDDLKPEDPSPKKRGRPCKILNLSPSSSKNPRKSPRQHASTLAILSNLLQQRKRKSRSLDTKASLPVIPEETKSPHLALQEPKPQENPEEPLRKRPKIIVCSRKPRAYHRKKPIIKIDYNLIASKMEDEINSTLEEEENFEEIEVEPEDSIDFKDSKVNISEILSMYDECLSKEDEKSTRRFFNGTPGRKPGRRKKKNKTGWPNKSKRLLKKDQLSAKDEGNDDNSTIESCSVRDSDVEDNDDDTNSTDSIKKKNSAKRDQVSLSDVNNVEENCDLNSDRVEHSDKVLTAKVTNSSEVQYQPYVCVQKLSSEKLFKNRINHSPTKRTSRRQRRMPGSPKSPRMLRKPRGRWYRER